MEQAWRDYFAEDGGEMVSRASQATAFLGDGKDRGPPVLSQTWRSGEKIPFGQTHSLRAFEKPPQVQTQALRDFEKHLNDLKKENFSLKLRIYFLEERMQQKYEASREDIYRRNIELKVEVESLKRELQDKKQHLDKTWADVENLNSHSEAELRRQYEERQQETEHTCELLESKIQLLQEESRIAKNEAARMAALVEAEKECNLELSEKLKGVTKDMEAVPGDQFKSDQYTEALAGKDKRIEELSQSLAAQEKLVEQLSQEKQQLLHLLEEPSSMDVQVRFGLLLLTCLLYAFISATFNISISYLLLCNKFLRTSKVKNKFIVFNTSFCEPGVQTGFTAQGLINLRSGVDWAFTSGGVPREGLLLNSPRLLAECISVWV